VTLTTVWVEDQKILKVEDRVTPQDILEFAEALIEEQGWRATQPGGDAGGGDTAPWTIHQAIGEAARRLEPDPATARKDGPVARPLRDEATALLSDHHGKTDIELNDECASQTQAIEILRAARGA
jgi:hypothetical protein